MSKVIIELDRTEWYKKDVEPNVVIVEKECLKVSRVNGRPDYDTRGAVFLQIDYKGGDY